jgi:hypothetical protein
MRSPSFVQDAVVAPRPFERARQDSRVSSTTNTVGDTDLTIEALPHLAKLPQLEALKLTALPITDKGLLSLAEMPRLRFLALDGTAVTDEGLQHLELLPELTFLDLRNTVISLDAINDFRKRHPKCFVKE